MPLSLYAAIVPAFQQQLGALTRMIDRIEADARERDISEREMLDACLIDDMLPFSYQVKSAVVHSMGAIKSVKAGIFSPDISTPPASFNALKGGLNDALAYLEALTPEAVNGLEGGDMRFEIGEQHIDFLAEDFLLSFSLPNFYFHVTTAYAIARMKGVPLGKRDYMGRMRKKR